MRLFNTFRNFTKLAYGDYMGYEDGEGPYAAPPDTSYLASVPGTPEYVQKQYDDQLSSLRGSNPNLDQSTLERMAARNVFDSDKSMTYDDLPGNLDANNGQALLNHMKSTHDTGFANSFIPRFLRNGPDSWTSNDVANARSAIDTGLTVSSLIPGLQPFAAAGFAGKGLGNMYDRANSGLYTMNSYDNNTGNNNFDWSGNFGRFGADLGKTYLDTAMASWAPRNVTHSMSWAARPIEYAGEVMGRMGTGLGNLASRGLNTGVGQALGKSLSGAGSTIGEGLNYLGGTRLGRYGMNGVNWLAGHGRNILTANSNAPVTQADYLYGATRKAIDKYIPGAKYVTATGNALTKNSVPEVVSALGKFTGKEVAKETGKYTNKQLHGLGNSDIRFKPGKMNESMYTYNNLNQRPVLYSGPNRNLQASGFTNTKSDYFNTVGF